MRDIIFRGKTSNNDWMYGGVYHDGSETRIRNQFYRSREVDPETVGQFTSFSDKYETRIFEDDIVKLFDVFVQICFMDGGFGYKLDVDFIGFSNHKNLEYILENMEVIGNIHDNPELLEGVEK